MRYVDINGTERYLTTLQVKYLYLLWKNGHLPMKTKAGSPRDETTFQRLQRRGLAVGVEWHCADSSECLTEITELGRQALRSVR